MIRAPRTGFVDLGPAFQNVVAIAQGAPEKFARAHKLQTDAALVGVKTATIQAQAEATAAQAALAKKRAQNRLILTAAAGAALLVTVLQVARTR